jgi:Predicted nucleic acid-binding protein, contains PIN domain
MAYLLDTNIAIYAGNKHTRVLEKFIEHAGGIVMSALTLVELHRGFSRAGQSRSILEMQLEILLQQVPVLPFDQTAAEIYGQIVTQLGWNRARDFDRMIAAHAISEEAVLVTNNTADFQDIPGLQVENWIS